MGVQTFIPRYRVLRTVSFGVAFFNLGLCFSMIAPTLVQLETLFSTTTQLIVWLLTSYSIGCLVGTAGTAFLFDRLNPELQLLLGLALGGLFFSICPFVHGLYGMIATMGAVGVCLGFVDSAGNSYCLCLWEGDKKKGPILQTIHVIWSIGASVGPLLTRPFLADLNQVAGGGHNSTACDPVTSRRQETLHFGGKSESDRTEGLGKPPLIVPTPITHEPDPAVTIAGDAGLLETDIARVRYAYVMAGCLFIIPVVCFVVSYILTGPSLFRAKPKHSAEDINNSKDTSSRGEYNEVGATSGWSRSKTTILLLTLPFIVLNTTADVTIGNFMAVYVIKELCWGNQTGSMVMTVLWAASFASRVASVPMSATLRPITMLAINMAVRLGALVILGCVSLEGRLVWPGMALMGLSCGYTFPTTLLYLSQYLLVTGRVASVIIMCTSITSIINPPLFGYVFESAARNWIIYIPLVLSFVQAGSLALVEFYVRKVGPRGAASAEESRPQSTQVPDNE